MSFVILFSRSLGVQFLNNMFFVRAMGGIYYLFVRAAPKTVGSSAILFSRSFGVQFLKNIFFVRHLGSLVCGLGRPQIRLAVLPFCSLAALASSS